MSIVASKDPQMTKDDREFHREKRRQLAMEICSPMLNQGVKPKDVVAAAKLVLAFLEGKK